MRQNGLSQTTGRGRLTLVLLAGCLTVLLSGCGNPLTVKHLNPAEPDAIGKNEGVVFGRVLFVTHSEERGEISFPPVFLGLVNEETKRRAFRAVMDEKTEVVEVASGNRVVHTVGARRPWFENDGTFYWVLPAGSYRIDALGWGFRKVLFTSDPDPAKLRAQLAFPLWPGKPYECGFAVSTDVFFTVPGDSGAVYIGSLLVDMDITMQKDGGVEVRKINHVEVRDDCADASGLLRGRCPSFGHAIEKRLVTDIREGQVSFVNRRCPTSGEMLAREIGAALMMAPLYVPIGRR